MSADPRPPADPSVSPADTPAYKRLTAMLAEGEGLDDAQPMYSPLGELRAFKAEMDALLAVGERDKAEIARLTAGLKELSKPKYGVGAMRVAGAVLAGEEDARPDVPVAVEEAIERADADRRAAGEGDTRQ